VSQFNGLPPSRLTYENPSYNSRIPVTKYRHVQSVSTAVCLLPLQSVLLSVCSPYSQYCCLSPPLTVSTTVSLLPLHVFKERTGTTLTFKVAFQSLSPSNDSIQTNILLKLCTYFLFPPPGFLPFLSVLFSHLGNIYIFKPSRNKHSRV
jgi:hypothetical protein